jgi:hypothetical protein
LGRKPVLVPQHKIMDGINATRQMLPRCWFDEVSARGTSPAFIACIVCASASCTPVVFQRDRGRDVIITGQTQDDDFGFV